MDQWEQRLIDRIRSSSDPEKAIQIAVSIIRDYLGQHQSFGEQAPAYLQAPSETTQ